jgi:transcriptional regulator with XRE-family HTH domain
MVLLPYKFMAKFKEKEKAILMRKQGISISDIAAKLNMSKSTVSMWCRDIVLSADAIANISMRSESKSTKALLKYTESLRIARQNNTEISKKRGKNTLGQLTKRDIYCIGIGLYWGEGYKRGSQEFGFTNSDPGMIKFYVKWLNTVFGVETKDLILRVSINELHRTRIKLVEIYWSKLLNIPLSSFTKPSLIKTQSKKIYSNSEMHFGTLRIKVRRGTNMRREVIGALEALSV